MQPSANRIGMVVLLHEVWITDDECGLQPACLVLAGPDGDAARRLLEPGAKLYRTFEAGCYFEAMTIYQHIFDMGDYETTHEWDRQPYPDKWLATQRGAPSS